MKQTTNKQTMRARKRKPLATKKLVVISASKMDIVKEITTLPVDDGIHAVKGKKGFQPVPAAKQKGNTISTALTDAEREALQMLAAMQGVSVSRLVRKAIRQYLKEQAMPKLADAVGADMQYSLFEDE